MSVTYGIAVEGASAPAGALMAAKKLTGLSLAEVRSALAEGRPLFECDCADEAGMELMLTLRSELEANGVPAKHLVNGRVEPFTHLENALRSYRSIDEVDGEEY